MGWLLWGLLPNTAMWKLWIYSYSMVKNIQTHCHTYSHWHYLMFPNWLQSPSAPLGGDVNAQASNGDTILYDAVGSGNLDCIKLLLQHGANPNVASNAYQLPIHRAAYEGHILWAHQHVLKLCGNANVHPAVPAHQMLQHSASKGLRASVFLKDNPVPEVEKWLGTN